jgi:hypothetical protein
MATSGMAEPNIRSIIRRLEFRARVHGYYDALLSCAALSNPEWLWRILWAPVLAIHECLEIIRVRTAFVSPGRPAQAALRVRKRMPQAPTRHRTYWIERDRQSHVGVLMGLDLVRNSGKYFLVEANINPALHPKRRALYDETFDPMIQALAERARAEELQRVVMVRGPAWSAQYEAEFSGALREFGIETLGRTMARDVRGNLRSLPSPLSDRTLYVVCSGWPGGPPLVRFLHEKWSQSEWLSQEIAEESNAFRYLRAISTALVPQLPEHEQSPAWPNIVLKLSDSDKGADIAMGRFDSEASALRGFGIDPAAPQSAPGVFGPRRPWSVLRRTLYRERNIFQPFVAPDLVGGHVRIIRLNMLVSPEFDTFLSAHGVVSPVAAPKEHPSGLTPALEPYLVNFKFGARYDRLPREIEEELVEVSREFGLAVRRAISKRYATETGVQT